MKSKKCKKCGKFFNPTIANYTSCDRCFDKQHPVNYSIDENLIDNVAEQKSVVCKIVKPKFFSRIKWAFKTLIGSIYILTEKKDVNK